MSTPIHQLPATASGAPSASGPQDDPELLNVLKEMEQEVAAAQGPSHPSPGVQAAPYIPRAPHGPQAMPRQAIAADSSLWNSERAKNAAIAGVIALVLFYPSTLQAVYGKFPKFSSIFDNYDLLIRALLFAVVLYVLMWKLDARIVF